MTSPVPPGRASLHRYPGTSCLATILLSLRDKSHSSIEAPHNYLSTYGAQSWAKPKVEWHEVKASLGGLLFYCPGGAEEFSPGFQPGFNPGKHPIKRFALKGREMAWAKCPSNATERNWAFVRQKIQFPVG
jgi:hypothetical protein